VLALGRRELAFGIEAGGEGLVLDGRDLEFVSLGLVEVKLATPVFEPDPGLSENLVYPALLLGGDPFDQLIDVAPVLAPKVLRNLPERVAEELVGVELLIPIAAPPSGPRAACEQAQARRLARCEPAEQVSAGRTYLGTAPSGR
jgi:hypothetical protein